jgi:hypothetical protein
VLRKRFPVWNMAPMTTAHALPRQSEDAAISAAVYKLLSLRNESVADLAYHTRISTASLYRKLGGQASWKAADLGAVARHFSIQPGDLFAGTDITGRPTGGPGGPEGGEECAIRDSNPEPADSAGRVFRFGGNRAARGPWAPPHPRAAAESDAAYPVAA